MSRRHRADKREITPDPKFKNEVVTKFMNSVMSHGKKSVAEQIVYGAFDIIQSKTKQDPLGIFRTALDNVMPSLEVRSRRVGGATYQVPMEVNQRRQQTLAIRIIVENSRGKKGKPMAQRLADELVDAFNNQGASITWRENTHKMAEANKLFAHFAW